MRTRQERVATDTWRSLGYRTTPLEHWSKRKPTVEPRSAKQQTKKLRPNPTKINSFMSGPSSSLTPDPPACEVYDTDSPVGEFWQLNFYYRHCSISEYLLQRLVMMRHVLSYWYFKKHSIPSSNGQREIMHVIQGFDERHIRIAKHSDCKTWLQFGRTEGSITKENIAYALMGTYEHLWGIRDLCDYNFDSQNTKYSFRPTHVWYEEADTWLT